MGPPGEGPAAKRARTGAKGKGKAAAAAAGVRSEEDAAALSACTSAVRALPSAARLAACATPQALAALKKALEAALTKARQVGASRAFSHRHGYAIDGRWARDGRAADVE